MTLAALLLVAGAGNDICLGVGSNFSTPELPFSDNATPEVKPAVYTLLRTTEQAQASQPSFNCAFVSPASLGRNTVTNGENWELLIDINLPGWVYIYEYYPSGSVMSGRWIAYKWQIKGSGVWQIGPFTPAENEPAGEHVYRIWYYAEGQWASSENTRVHYRDIAWTYINRNTGKATPATTSTNSPATPATPAKVENNDQLYRFFTNPWVLLAGPSVLIVAPILIYSLLKTIRKKRPVTAPAHTPYSPEISVEMPVPVGPLQPTTFVPAKPVQKPAARPQPDALSDNNGDKTPRQVDADASQSAKPAPAPAPKPATAPKPEPVTAPPITPVSLLGGRYEITRRDYKRGGMAVISLARDLQNGGQKVVVKTPRLDSSNSTQLNTEKLLQEAKYLKQAAHPHIVKYIDFFSDKAETPYLVLEYIDGTNLRKEFEIIPAGEQSALSWACQILDALEYIHNQGYIHRDLNPGNIMLSGGQVRLIDFGTIKNKGYSTYTGFYKEGFNIPEVAAKGWADERSDIYGVGGTLYYILTCEAPGFIRDRDVVSVLISRGISRRMAGCIDQALQMDPRFRYESAAAMRTALTEEKQAP